MEELPGAHSIDISDPFKASKGKDLSTAAFDSGDNEGLEHENYLFRA